MKEIKVSCFPDGTVKVSTSGYRGKACRRATAGVERALGGEVLSDEDTAEAALPEESSAQGRHVEQS